MKKIQELKLAWKIRKYPPLKRFVCEVLQGDWDTHGRVCRIGIAILGIVYRESLGKVEASNFIPYLTDNDIDFTGEELMLAFERIEKNSLVKDGNITLPLDGKHSLLEWAMAGACLEGWIDRKWERGEWYYKNTPKGNKKVEEMISRPQ